MEQRRIGVRGLIYHNKKLYGQQLVKTAGHGYWCTPGGGIDPMESLYDALQREMIEETGIKPVIGRLIFVQQFATGATTSHGEKEQLEFFFLVTNSEDYLNVELSKTSHGEIEVADHGFVDPVEKNMLPKILQTQELIRAIETEQPVLFHTEL